MGGSSTLLFQHALSKALKDPDVKAVMLVADSPGGTVLGTAEAAKAMLNFSKKKPLHTHITGRGTSAMYWLGVNSSLLTADPTAEIGSVGALQILTDRSKQYSNLGVKKILVTSPGSTKKGMGFDGAAITEDDQKEISLILGDLCEPFYADVKHRRNLPDSIMDEVKKAGIFVGQKAMDKGLVDGIGFTDDAYEHLKQSLAGSSSSRVIDSGIRLSEHAAANKDKDMPLTTEQVAKIQKFKGLETVTADNGADAIIAAYEQTYSAANVMSETAAELRTANTALDAQLKEAKAKLAAPMTDRERALATQLAASKRDAAVTAGGMTPACAELIVKAFGDDPEAQAKVFDALATNKPTPKQGETTIAPVADPNAAAAAVDEGAKVAAEWQKRQVAQRGLTAA